MRLQTKTKTKQNKGKWDGKWDVGPKSPLLELAQHRAAVTGEGDRRAERNNRPGRSYTTRAAVREA